MRTLVVYYSYGGTTRRLAEALAKALGADIAQVRCSRYGGGVMSFLSACYDSITGRLPAIEVTPSAHVGNYDLVIAGAPIWAGHAATPIRTYLAERRQLLKRVAFFVTSGGPAKASVFDEMAQVSGNAAEATLALRTAEVLGGNVAATVETFAQSFRPKAAA